MVERCRGCGAEVGHDPRCPRSRADEIDTDEAGGKIIDLMEVLGRALKRSHAAPFEEGTK